MDLTYKEEHSRIQTPELNNEKVNLLPLGQRALPFHFPNVRSDVVLC